MEVEIPALMKDHCQVLEHILTTAVVTDLELFKVVNEAQFDICYTIDHYEQHSNAHLWQGNFLASQH